MSAVIFDNVSIVFGKQPKQALPLMDQGQSRSEVQAETGQVLGVHDCSLTVEKGEILVLMGLSGSGKSTLLRAVNALNPVAGETPLLKSFMGEDTPEIRAKFLSTIPLGRFSTPE
ncbi:MAG: ATP-binding cassette domain-containing protein, partial [Pseudomonadota bacterium]